MSAFAGGGMVLVLAAMFVWFRGDFLGAAALFAAGISAMAPLVAWFAMGAPQ